MKNNHGRKTARYAAIETLHKLQQTKLPVSTIFERTIAQHRIGQTDRQLAMKICYGVLRQKEYLDLLLSILCNQPTNKIKPFAYHALQTGLYQLFFLDRVPESAAVNETVKAVAAAGLPTSIKGFVNGVLRQSIRKRTELPAPGSSSLLNHPRWLTDRWELNFGKEKMQRICLANNSEQFLCLRAASGISTDELIELFRKHDIIARPGRYAPDAVIVENYQRSVTLLPGFEQGIFLVQDQAAQLATLLLAPFFDGARYLDCCAGVGGKTAHLLRLTAGIECTIVALDPSTERFGQLQDNLTRLTGSSKVSTYNTRIENFQPTIDGHFDAVLVDAPCSGTGVTGRHPDIRWNRTENQLPEYQERQLFLLDEAVKHLLPGGVLVYATCSIEPEENLMVINHFQKNHPHFTLTDCHDYLPSQAHEFIYNSCFSPLPDEEIDGFFAARLTSTLESD